MAKQPHRKGFSGDRFGRLVIISDVPFEERKNTRKREVICLCDCGKTVRVNTNNLFSGNTSSCGCYELELIHQRRKHDLIGKRFGKLTVIEELGLVKNRRQFKCKCDCGNFKNTFMLDLLRGRIKSCGCYRKEFHKQRMTEDITGQTFNELTAIRQIDDYVLNDYRRSRWLFKCSCGKEIEAFTVNVKHGKTKSCGHIGQSIAEYKISQWLDSHEIEYEREASFDDLINNQTGRKLKFDFKVYRKDNSFFLVEHQGEQHFFGNDNKFGKQQRDQTDKTKKNYCKIKGITLYETLFDEDYIEHLETIIQKEIVREGDAYESEVTTDECF